MSNNPPSISPKSQIKIKVSPKVSPKGGNTGILRSHTSNPNTMTSYHESEDDEEDPGLKEEFFESDMARRMSKAHAKRFMPKDLYETIPFFKEIPQKDRQKLKEALREEVFSAGDVIFNYSTLHFIHF